MWDYEVSCPSTDWRIWTLASSSVHLVILLVVLLLVSCGWWPSWHHRRIEGLNLETRTEIARVVNENWDQLLKIAKDLVDARLEDGENINLYNSKIQQVLGTKKAQFFHISNLNPPQKLH